MGTRSPLFSKISILTFTTWTKALLLAGFIIVSPTWIDAFYFPRSLHISGGTQRSAVGVRGTPCPRKFDLRAVIDVCLWLKGRLRRRWRSLNWNDFNVDGCNFIGPCVPCPSQWLRVRLSAREADVEASLFIVFPNLELYGVNSQQFHAILSYSVAKDIYRASCYRKAGTQVHLIPRICQLLQRIHRWEDLSIVRNTILKHGRYVRGLVLTKLIFSGAVLTSSKLSMSLYDPISESWYFF